MNRNFNLFVFLFITFFTANTMAEKMTTEMTTPTVALKSAVQSFIAIATNKALTRDEKKAKITEVVKSKMDLKILSIRVVSRPWKKATAEERTEFTDLFTKVVVNTYFSLLEKYTNEKVDYLKEEIKKKKYAKVNTNIVMSDKNIPVTYKLILRKGLWRIYDFSAEGISMVSTYRSNYKAILKKSGLAGLNEALKAKMSKS